MTGPGTGTGSTTIAMGLSPGHERQRRHRTAGAEPGDVERAQGVDDRPLVELLDGDLATATAQPHAQPGIADETLERVRQARDIAELDRKAGLAVTHRL